MNNPDSDLLLVYEIDSRIHAVTRNGLVFSKNNIASPWILIDTLDVDNLNAAAYDDKSGNIFASDSQNIYVINKEYNVILKRDHGFIQDVRLVLATGILCIAGNNGIINVYDRLTLSLISSVKLQDAGICTTCDNPPELKCDGKYIYIAYKGVLYVSFDTLRSTRQLLFGVVDYAVIADSIFIPGYNIDNSGKISKVSSVAKYIYTDSLRLIHVTAVQDSLYTSRILLNGSIVYDSLVFMYGKKKQLLVSRDYGNSWRWLSYLDESSGPIMSSTKIGYCQDVDRIYSTTNTGATWRVQRFNSATDFLNYDTDGFCKPLSDSEVVIVSSDNVDNGQVNIVYSLDSGRSVMTRREPVMFANQDAYIPIVYGNTHSKYIARSKKGYKTIYTQFNKLSATNEIVSTTYLDSLLFYDVKAYKDSCYAAIVYDLHDSIKIRSIYKSVDNGLTWRAIAKTSNMCSIYDRSIVIDSLLCFMTHSLVDSTQNLYKYQVGTCSLESGVLQSDVFADTSELVSGIAKFDNKVWLGGSGFLLNRVNLYNSSTSWANENIDYRKKYFVLYGDSAELVVGFLQKDKTGNYLRNVFIMTKTEKDVSAVEKVLDSPLLVAGRAAPNPAVDHVSIKVSWDMTQSISHSSFALFDAVGARVSSDKYNINVANFSDHNGVLLLSVRDVDRGAYYLRICVQGECCCVSFIKQ